MFEESRWVSDNIFGIGGNGFVIRENVSPENIENCNGVARKDEKTGTCVLCVALNDTVFRNDNKPVYYHPNCKCKIKKYNLNDVRLDFPMSKINGYLFKDKAKRALMESMGYDLSYAEFVYEIIAENAKRKFLSGDYKLETLNCNGQKINIVLELEGQKDKKGRLYRFNTGWTVYPKGCLHNNTPFGGWIKG